MQVYDIVVFDFETGGLDPLKHEAVEIAGKAYNGMTLEPYPDGEFCSLMKPERPEDLQPKALEVNGRTVEELMKAPDAGVVWKSFVEWVNRYNKGAKRTGWTAPIASGKNIRSFDFKFADELNKKHCKNGVKTVLFNVRRQFDLEDFIGHWFIGSGELENEKMDTLRDFFGMSHDGAHGALVDVRQTGALVMKFLRLTRTLYRKSKEGATVRLSPFKGCFDLDRNLNN